MTTLAQACRGAEFSKPVEVRQYFLSKAVVLLKGIDITPICRKYFHLRDDRQAGQKGVIGNNTTYEPMLDARVTLKYSRFGFQVPIDFLANDGPQSWVFMSRGVDRHVTDFSTECKQSVRPVSCVSEVQIQGFERSIANSRYSFQPVPIPQVQRMKITFR